MHVIFGAGPVGTTLALELADHGEAVRVLSRSGSGPVHPAVTRQRVDATDADAARRATADATVIYNALNPPYTSWDRDWPPLHHNLMDAAAASGAVLVLMDNLYGYGDTNGAPITTSSPLSATGAKGATRARMSVELLDAHAAGHLRATIARASDFFGPRVIDASFGERVVPNVLAGKTVRVLGALDQPHSLAYMPDVARTLAVIGRDERAWGRAWHVPSAPAMTQAEIVQMLADAAGTTVKTAAVPSWMLRGMGIVSPMMRSLREVEYQFAKPFVVDASDTKTTFALSATPLAEACAETVAWWRERTTTTAGAAATDPRAA
jgi:nucleoside-diphosphate-sugar epimerase